MGFIWLREDMVVKSTITVAVALAMMPLVVLFPQNPHPRPSRRVSNLGHKMAEIIGGYQRDIVPGIQSNVGNP
jgi:hypothetical protein